MIVTHYTLSGRETLPPWSLTPPGRYKRSRPWTAAGLRSTMPNPSCTRWNMCAAAREGLLDLSFSDDERLKTLARKALKP